MIFVTAGTTKFPFARLEDIVLKLNLIYPEKTIIFQNANPTSVFPGPIRLKKYLSPVQFTNFLKRAEIVVTHAGYATIMQALRYSHVRPIDVPRRNLYKEHVNDHQVYFARYMNAKRLILIVEEPDQIEKVLKSSRYSSNTVKKYLKSVEKKKGRLIKYLQSIT